MLSMHSDWQERAMKELLKNKPTYDDLNCLKIVSEGEVRAFLLLV